MKVAARPGIVALLVLLAACSTLRKVQRGAASIVLPPAQEAALAERVDRELHQQLRIVEAPEIQRYVAGVVERVGAPSAAARGPVQLHVEVVDDPKQVNAFATVGGNLYVYTGLLRAVGSEAELAAVLAHETAHVANRDVAQQMVAQFGLQTIAGAALGKNPNLIAQIATQLAGTGALAAYTRSQETAADETGLRYLTQAGYDPQAMIGMFEKLQQVQGGGEGNFFTRFFQTHPSPKNRIANIRKEIAELEGGGQSGGESGGGERNEAAFADFQRQLESYYAGRQGPAPM